MFLEKQGPLEQGKTLEWLADEGMVQARLKQNDNVVEATCSSQISMKLWATTRPGLETRQEIPADETLEERKRAYGLKCSDMIFPMATRRKCSE